MEDTNWTQLISEQKASGQTIDDFCMSRGVNKYTFKKRKYKAAVKVNGVGEEFIEIRREMSVLNVKLKNGRTLEIRGGFNEGEVRRIIRLLELC